MNKLQLYREQIDKINYELLELLNQRANVAVKIGEEKQKMGINVYDPVRENEIIGEIIEKNSGPFSDEAIIKLFKDLFKASIELQSKHNQNHLLVSRATKKDNSIISVKGIKIGSDDLTFIAGPCSIESFDQLESVAKTLKETDVKFIRGGAFKPRTSPYDFQGLGIEGLKIMKSVADKYQLISVVEIMDVEQLRNGIDYIDVVQVGARNMQNFTLLKALGKIDKPILLKRGLAATIEEFKNAAEYIMAGGNNNIILCERGIRTYERATRNTLDISAVPILKLETHLPVIVDVSHASGRKDIIEPLVKAAIAAGADGVMLEIHPQPNLALSDSQQQLSLIEFKKMINNISIKIT